ncbi:MAG: S-methyl-5-thioribose-1-phosphate isomerase, partial [Candidatus Omnitrophica bacterium]|nr:S-methyl-5-thioribose-1-phosphate isomerase [Candidatus Omnitrophota bacterium]
MKGTTMQRKAELRSISWQGNRVVIIDQTELPAKLLLLRIGDVRVLWQAIKELKVRGAPALGAAAALGAYLAVKDSRARNYAEFSRQLKKALAYIASSRPTARNLFYGLERIAKAAAANKGLPVSRIKGLLLREAQNIMEEDRRFCENIAGFGQRLLKSGDTVLTVCNAGMLATVGCGTALGVIYAAKKKGKKIKVYACETRPLLQGARLTAWELQRQGLDVTLICDNMAATLMRQGKIDAVIAGADRIASNGDAANKIGTYSLAVLSNFHKIPFYIA